MYKMKSYNYDEPNFDKHVFYTPLMGSLKKKKKAGYHEVS